MKSSGTQLMAVSAAILALAGRSPEGGGIYHLASSGQKADGDG